LGGNVLGGNVLGGNVLGVNVLGVNVLGDDEMGKEAVEETPLLVRIHSECFTGETLGSLRCDCADQLDQALRLIQQEGRGLVVYLKQEGRGIGLIEKLKAYNLQDQRYDTVAANVMLSHLPDGRSYDVAAHLLQDLGVGKVRLLTNNPDKVAQLQKAGIQVASQHPMVPTWWLCDTAALDTAKSVSLQHRAEADYYLQTKVQKMGHLLTLPNHLQSLQSLQPL